MPISKQIPLAKNIFENLANTHGLHCVSIYLPMHKDGKEQNEHLAQVNLKYCIKQVNEALEKHQIEADKINDYLKPVEALLADVELWRNPSDGLAIFLDKKGMRHYTFPISFETKTIVSDYFFLLPLLPLYNETEDYYLLELSQDYIKLFEANKFGYKDIHIEDFAPDILEKAVGFDFKPKMLEFRTGQTGQNGAKFHGHGAGKDDLKDELFRFFREIDKGINKVISNKKAPLIIACSLPLLSIYKKANTYPNLMENHITGDTEFKNKTELYFQSLKIVKPFLEKTKEEKIQLFNNLYHTPKASSQISEIVPAAVNGKIDSLFIQYGADEFGVFDKKSNQIMFDKKSSLNYNSLTNLSAMNTFLQGGKVFILDKNEMPVQGHIMNALYRY